MKKYSLFIVIALIFTFQFKAQSTAFEKYVLSQLTEVEEGKSLSPKSWLVTAENDTIQFKKFEKKWVLIDFWFTGCAPCIKEFPNLATFQNRNKGKIEVIAVSVDSKFNRFLKSSKKYNIGFQNYYAGFTYSNPIFNLNINAALTNEGTFKFQTITPQYVLINPDGKIVDRNLPKPSDAAFKTVLESYMKLKLN